MEEDYIVATSQHTFATKVEKDPLKFVVVGCVCFHVKGFQNQMQKNVITILKSDLLIPLVHKQDFSENTYAEMKHLLVSNFMQKIKKNPISIWKIRKFPMSSCTYCKGLITKSDALSPMLYLLSYWPLKILIDTAEFDLLTPLVRRATRKFLGQGSFFS